MGTADRGRNNLALAVALSLLAHVLILPVFSTTPTSAGVDHGLAPARLARVRLLKEKVKQNLDINGQIVDIVDASHISKTAPKDTKFLSDRNRIVDKETQARLTGLPSPGTSPALGSLGGGGRRGESGSVKLLNRPGRGVGYGANGPDLSVPKPFLDRDTKLQRQASMAPSNYLPDISFGEETILNTKEYVYSSFFVRMKRQMEANWNPLRWINRFQEHTDEYITALQIVLAPDGYLERVEVISPSGHSSLDQEAMAAVRLGSPFLNPPKELVDTDGKIHIGPWRFIVSLTRRF